MTFPDFLSGPHASVQLGVGATKKIQFTADDGSCRWNDFPIYIFACGIRAAGGSTSDSKLIVDPLTLAAGTSSTNAQWPAVVAYGAYDEIMAGNKLQIRILGALVSLNTLISGGVTNEATGLCFSFTNPGNGYDSGWQDCSATCAQMDALGHDYLTLSPFLTNSAGAGRIFTHWEMQSRYVANTSPAIYAPNQEVFAHWKPPCETGAGLYLGLETDGCGVLTRTYNEIANFVNNLGLGITATILGGHGGDIAQPSDSDGGCAHSFSSTLCSSTPVTAFACVLAGAECSGTIDN